MKKLVILGLAAVIALGAGLALAKAVKFNLLSTGVLGYEGASGQAILNYAQGAGTTEVQVNCWGLKAGEVYYVYYYDKGWGLPALGTFTALKNGSGNFHIKVAGDISKATLVGININVWDTVLINQ